MRRWDSLVDSYIDEYVARGLTGDQVNHVQRELERWGNWLKGGYPVGANTYSTR